MDPEICDTWLYGGYMRIICGFYAYIYIYIYIHIESDYVASILSAISAMVALSSPLRGL